MSTIIDSRNLRKTDLNDSGAAQCTAVVAFFLGNTRTRGQSLLQVTIAMIQLRFWHTSVDSDCATPKQTTQHAHTRTQSYSSPHSRTGILPSCNAPYPRYHAHVAPACT